MSGRQSRWSSWPSKANRQDPPERRERPSTGIGPDELPDGTAHRPLSVRGDVTLRNEAVRVQFDNGDLLDADNPDELAKRSGGKRHAKPVHAVVDEWRDWMQSPIYTSGHIEMQNRDGETAYKQPSNSFQQDYNAKYYARFKDLERGVERRLSDPTTVMLTLSSTSLNANGGRRCPADHIRSVVEGWKTSRKQLPHIIPDDLDYYVARIFEPHESGYGHLHIGVFIDDPNNEITADQFSPLMDSHVRNSAGAGTEAHTNTPCHEHDDGGNPWREAESACDDCENPVSVNHSVGDIAQYLSAYMGIYTDERALDRPVSEQMFFAACWATSTRRLDFGQDAQELIQEQRRLQRLREDAQARPEDRGGDAEGQSTGWTLNHLCTVTDGQRYHADAGGSGGRRSTTLDERKDGLDPPRVVR